MQHRIERQRLWWSVLITAALGLALPLRAQTPQFLNDVASYRLPNGLRVVLAPDTNALHVSAELWLASGTTHDPRGQRGTAHLLEHVSAALAAPIDTAGRRKAQPFFANSNAQVRRDHARYFLLVDPSALDAALAIHAARLALDPAAITDSIVRQHADIVVNEGRGEGAPITEGVQPYWRLQTGTYGDSHPYGLIGESETSVRSISVADLRAFANAHAAVGDAVLLVVGAFDVEAARARITARFGALPARASGAPRRWRELPLTQALRRDVQRAISGPSRLTRRFPVPPLGDPALEHTEVALRMAAARWQRTAKLRQPPRVTIEPGMLASDLTIDGELTTGDGVIPASRALDSALIVVANGDTTGLGEARGDAAATFLALLDPLGFQRSRSEQLGEATFFAGDVHVAQSRLSRLQRAAPRDVMRAATDWLVSRGYELALAAQTPGPTSQAGLPTNAPMELGNPTGRRLPTSIDTTVNGVRFIVTARSTLPLVRATVVGDSLPLVTRQRATGDTAQLWSWLRALRTPSAGATVYLTGDMVPRTAIVSLTRATQSWPRATARTIPAPAYKALTPGVHGVASPGRTQTELRIEMRIASATPDDEVALRVLRRRLTAALNTRLRTERRWSYGANSSAFVEGDSTRLVITADVQPDRSRESLDEARAIVRDFANGTIVMPSAAVLAEEIRQELRLDHSTLTGIEGALRADVAAGRAVNWRGAVLTRVEALTADDLERARRLAEWTRMSVTLTGDPQYVRDLPSGR